ncbi:SDR family oxidoreductase [Microbacterium hydrocarbonoxydans]|uniref:SDR family oxidoreductase n=1 Tax=Microbacterium hydrocarbonoxydans TaxID=273678 RepID=UPI00203B74A6|nr:SDR family oxidoreductase [Microbacterium hydrocarbonoxydans]MCM3779210.1 SDR family oxidoreductase [Microbacterium hydrocarbonoxydans]
MGTHSRKRRRNADRHPRRPLAQQVVVITGGGRGIGRATAIRLAKAGASVVVLGRGEARLTETVELISASGGTARHIVCDVSDAAAVQAAADQAEAWFGRIDTWVNNAGVLLYGRFEETTPDEFRRIMEIDYLGQIHGAQAALPALRRAGGGTLISVSSVEGRTTLPLHSAYAASKRAVDGAMQGLRRERIDQRDPISVTVVRPAVIDTPLYASAASHLRHRPAGPPPFYGSEVVAACIAYAAEHPVDEIYAGGGGRMLALAQTVAPGLLDAVLGRWGVRMMHTREASSPRQGNLAVPDHHDDPGALPRRGRRWSIYTWLVRHPRARRRMLTASAITAAALLGSGTAHSSPAPDRRSRKADR